MATAATLSYVRADEILSTWALEDSGPTDEERIHLMEEAIAQLKDNAMVEKFKANVRKVATRADKADVAFEKVTRKFGDMVVKYGKDFAGFASYNVEWSGYNKRWSTYLNDSLDVASEQAACLLQLDEVYIEKVLNVKTDEDRVKCIAALQRFIDEPHDKSVLMKQNFETLRDDIRLFVDRLTSYIDEEGIKLYKAASNLINEIKHIQDEIDDLDDKIKKATVSLGTLGGCLNILGVVVPGTVLGAFQTQRNATASKQSKKQTEFADINRGKQAELARLSEDKNADINRKQAELAQLSWDFSRFEPDIRTICKQLTAFGEIWSEVRRLTVQFQKNLVDGVKADDNDLFKKLLELARAICTPLRDGLEEYATELSNRT